MELQVGRRDRLSDLTSKFTSKTPIYLHKFVKDQGPFVPLLSLWNRKKILSGYTRIKTRDKVAHDMHSSAIFSSVLFIVLPKPCCESVT